ncbi:hypothetical protein EYQ95_17105 [Lysobacter sp. N42]|nr:hypothetical protein EYQ95_17105 [Lysobacter sp. N42]
MDAGMESSCVQPTNRGAPRRGTNVRCRAAQPLLTSAHEEDPHAATGGPAGRAHRPRRGLRQPRPRNPHGRPRHRRPDPRHRTPRR